MYCLSDRKLYLLIRASVARTGIYSALWPSYVLSSGAMIAYSRRLNFSFSAARGNWENPSAIPGFAAGGGRNLFKRFGYVTPETWVFGNYIENRAFEVSFVNCDDIITRF